jgi:hypothetical protein
MTRQTNTNGEHHPNEVHRFTVATTDSRRGSHARLFAQEGKCIEQTYSRTAALEVVAELLQSLRAGEGFTMRFERHDQTIVVRT